MLVSSLQPNAPVGARDVPVRGGAGEGGGGGAGGIWRTDPPKAKKNFPSGKMKFFERGARLRGPFQVHNFFLYSHYPPSLPPLEMHWRGGGTPTSRAPSL